MTRKQVLSGAEARARYPRLAKWWDAAKLTGTIWSRVDVSRSGMSATVLLYTVQTGHDGKPSIEVCWPDGDSSNGFDECAKRIGFSFKRRAFTVGGCGFNRALEVADRVSLLMDGTPFPQQLVRLDTLNQPEGGR